MTSNQENTKEIRITRRQWFFFSWTKDVLIYIVVLNLFVEYNSKIVIDSFTISIFTAIMLKILLEIVLRFEHWVAEFFKSRPGRLSGILRILITWLILFSSKFLILEVEDLVFGEHVELGNFLDVIILVIALMVARALFNQAFVLLGEAETASA